MAVNENNVLFTTGYNYQKIALKSTGSVSVPNAPTTFTSVTINHNLGYIPSVRAWYDPALGRRLPLSLEQYQDDDFSTNYTNLVVAQAYLTTTTLVLQFRNSSGSTKSVNYWYRIYYDT